MPFDCRNAGFHPRDKETGYAATGNIQSISGVSSQVTGAGEMAGAAGASDLTVPFCRLLL